MLAGSIIAMAFSACGGSNAAPIASAVPEGGGLDIRAAYDGGGDGNTSTTNDGGVGVDGGGSDRSTGPNPGVVSCGGSDCSDFCCVAVGAGGAAPSCVGVDAGSCEGHRIFCDDSVDCRDDQMCCGEPLILGQPGIFTTCRTSCSGIEGGRAQAGRVQICKTDRECVEGSCRAYDCGDVYPTSLRYCNQPPGCK